MDEVEDDKNDHVVSLEIPFSSNQTFHIASLDNFKNEYVKHVAIFREECQLISFDSYVKDFA
jgi:hypothetical protein